VTRSTVTGAYVRPRAFVRVQGPDAADLLQRVLSNDVLAADSCEALLLTP
jgi:folate-binding Fe-S cluster repair protein YgfZ